MYDEIANLDTDLMRFCRMIGSRLSPIRAAWTQTDLSGLEFLNVSYAQPADPEILGGSQVMQRFGMSHGVRPQSALCGAIGEALERYASTSIPCRAQIIRSSHASLRERFKLPSLEDIRLFSDSQLKGLQFNLKNLAEHDEVDWLSGVQFDGREKSEIYYPLPRLTLNATQARPYERPTSSGFALGSSYESALNGALGEILERDAFLSAWWLKKSPPAYTHQDLLEALGPNEWVAWLQERILVLDLTETWGVPTFASTLWGRVENSEPALLVGAATHPEARIALDRAIGESLRAFARNLQGLRSGQHGNSSPRPPYDDSIRNFRDVGLLYASPAGGEIAEFLKLGPRPGSHALHRRLASPPVDSMKNEVCRRAARVLAFDMTPIDLATGGLWLVRVVVPEAIPINGAHRIRPLGCKKLRKFSESELNPMPHPFT